MKLRYPSVNDVIDTNKMLVRKFRITKAEKHQLLKPRTQIKFIIDRAKRSKGNIKTKGAILLHDLNRSHIFGSANKRTAWLVASEFIKVNTGKTIIKKKEDYKFMMGVREGRYTIKDIVRWLDE